MPAISALGRWKQKSEEFKVILSHIVTLRSDWAVWDLASKKKNIKPGCSCHTLFIVLISERSPAKILNCLRNVMDFEQRVSLIQNPNTFIHCNWLNKHWSGSYPRDLSVSCFFLCLVGIYFLKKAGHLPCSMFCYLSFLLLWWSLPSIGL